MNLFAKLSLAMVFLVIIAQPLYAALDQGLILYFPFDSANGKDVPDESPGGHDGILIGDAEIDDEVVKVGQGALRIEPQSAVMQVEAFTELEEYQDNSYIFWLYFIEGSNGAWSQIIAKTGPGDRSPGIWTNPGSTGIHYRYNPGNIGFSAIGPTGEGSTYDLEVWYHIACVKDGAELRFYVNGEEQGTTVVPETHDNSGGMLHVGKSPTYRAATFVIDDLAIYDRALEEEEVVEIMEGKLANTAVDAAGKLASTWGVIRYGN